MVTTGKGLLKPDSFSQPAHSKFKNQQCNAISTGGEAAGQHSTQRFHALSTTRQAADDTGVKGVAWTGLGLCQIMEEPAGLGTDIRGILRPSVNGWYKMARWNLNPFPEMTELAKTRRRVSTQFR